MDEYSATSNGEYSTTSDHSENYTSFNAADSTAAAAPPAGEQTENGPVKPMRPFKRRSLSNQHSKSQQGDKPFDTSFCNLALENVDNDHSSVPVAAKSREAWDSFISISSGLYALILVILSFAFELCVLLSEQVKSNKQYEPFYIYLYSCGILFLVYSFVFLLRPTDIWKFPALFCRKRNADGSLNSVESKTECNKVLKTRVSHSAPTAGSLYLRLGCIVFGAVGMIRNGLRVYFICIAASDEDEQYSLSSAIEAALEAVFIFVQMYFIFQNSKMIIHRWKNFGRLGTMHLVATNLCIWIRLLVVEEFEVIREVQESEHGNIPGTATKISNHSHLVSSSAVKSPSHHSEVIECQKTDFDCTLKVFGAVGMIRNGLRVYFICIAVSDEDEQYSLSSAIEAALEAVFIFVQMYFIFQNSKMIIHRWKNFGRLGTMHLVATNLCIWIRLLVVEEFEVIREVQESEHGNIPGTATKISNHSHSVSSSAVKFPSHHSEVIECQKTDFDCTLKGTSIILKARDSFRQVCVPRICQ